MYEPATAYIICANSALVIFDFGFIFPLEPFIYPFFISPEILFLAQSETLLPSLNFESSE